MARKYGARFREFIGGQIVVSGARQVKNFFEVSASRQPARTGAVRRHVPRLGPLGQDKFLRSPDRGDQPASTERTEVGAMLDRRGGNIDALIADLQRAS